jgi:hypothetical protein
VGLAVSGAACFEPIDEKPEGRRTYTYASAGTAPPAESAQLATRGKPSRGTARSSGGKSATSADASSSRKSIIERAPLDVALAAGELLEGVYRAHTGVPGGHVRAGATKRRRISTCFERMLGRRGLTVIGPASVLKRTPRLIVHRIRARSHMASPPIVASERRSEARQPLPTLVSGSLDRHTHTHSTHTYRRWLEP